MRCKRCKQGRMFRDADNDLVCMACGFLDYGKDFVPLQEPPPKTVHPSRSVYPVQGRVSPSFGGPRA